MSEAPSSRGRHRIAVVSPFLDKRHGTERCVIEQVTRLAQSYEIYVYAQRVEDMEDCRVVWRRIPSLPGPHLFKFCWWLLANHLCRAWDRIFRGMRFDLVYTPGTNCLDADVISVHILFAEFYRQVKDDLRLRRSSLPSWHLLIHRRLYYNLVMALERIIYRGKKRVLTTVSKRSAENMARLGWNSAAVIYHGVDRGRFNPEVRARRRDASRSTLGISSSALCLLLVGNGWRNKGLGSLLRALGKVSFTDWQLLIAGQDDPLPYREVISGLGLDHRVRFLPPRPDVEFYFAASDVCVTPSWEDAFGLPPLEAMACGLPIIISRRAGVSELVTDGQDGLVLDDPRDEGALAHMIDRLYSAPAYRQTLGEAAAATARQHTWDRNAAQLDALFAQVLAHRQSPRLAEVPSSQ